MLIRPIVIALIAVSCARSEEDPGRVVTKLAEGVYSIEHSDPRRSSGSGNSTVIIGDRQVFVVDSCFLPSDARKDIEQIRRWTDKPVAFVLNTHFHNDHNYGNRVYQDAFPGVTIAAHIETKHDMDLVGPTSAERYDKSNGRLQRMLDTGKTADGQQLDAEDIQTVKTALAKRSAISAEMHGIRFQTATLTFEQGFTVDLGNREVRVMFLGRGNTAGDTIAYLPKEKIAAVGDLLIHPIPYFFDGYPSSWVHTLERLAQLDIDAIVPGHGPVLRDKAFLNLVHDVMKSAIDQLQAYVGKNGPAMSLKIEDVNAAIDLSPFRDRFVQADPSMKDRFDNTARQLIKLVFAEAALR